MSRPEPAAMTRTGCAVKEPAHDGGHLMPTASDPDGRVPELPHDR